MADNREEYRLAVACCAIAGNLLVAHDLPKKADAISRAETLGPVLDPTLYREKSGAMQEDKELVDAAMPLYRLMKKRAEASRG